MDRRSFLGSSLAVAAMSALGGADLFAATTIPKRHVLKARGLQIFEGNLPVRLRGVNLGGWMLIEDYMIGLPWTEWKIREQFRRVLGEQAYRAFFDAYADSYINDADIAFLAKQGFTFVRLPFNYRHFESDIAPGKWIEAGFSQLDRVVQLCRKHNLWALLDLHAAPGAQARDQNAGSAYGETFLWSYKDFMDRTAALWKEIARRYRGDPAIAGYNVLCEPVADDVKRLNEFYSQVIRAVREVDPDHLIVLDSNRWAKEVASLEDPLFEDPQVVPALHHYYTDNSYFARLTTYPGSVDGKRCDRAALVATLDGKHDQRRIRRPILASEFGIDRKGAQPVQTQLAITRDLISIFEERDWGWSLWCYKDLEHMGLLMPRADTPWSQFVNSEEIAGFFRRYDQLHQPFVENVGKLLEPTDIDKDTREQWAREVRRDFDAPALDFVLRRLAGRTPSQLAEMARSFSFESCTINNDYLGTLSPFLVRS